MNKFAEQYLEGEEKIYNQLDYENLKEIFPRLEKQKELADKSGLWKYRVKSRRMIIWLGYEFDCLERSIGEMLWLVGQWEMHKGESELEEGMVLLERFIEYLPAFPNVAREDIQKAISALKEWFATTSREPHYLDWALFKTYLKLGDTVLVNKYRQQLLDLEAVTPFGFKSSTTSCDNCLRCRKIHYYSSIGLLDKAMETARPLLEDDASPCLTSPRTGLSHLLDAFLDAGMVEEVTSILPTFTLHLNMPTKAPLRIVIPLLRYYLEIEDDQGVNKIVEDYASLVSSLADRWSVNRYLTLLGSRLASPQSS